MSDVLRESRKETGIGETLKRARLLIGMFRASILCNPFNINFVLSLTESREF